MSILKRYWATLRRMRVLHVMKNLVNYGRLKRNKSLYDRYGIGKSVVGSIAHKDISRPGHDIPWLDKPGAADILKKNAGLDRFPAQWQQQVLKWPENGFMILDGFADALTCQQINTEVEALITSGQVDFDYTRSRVMNAWKQSPAISAVMRDPLLMQFLSFTLGREVAPFQTISFLKGSRQKTHSDFIHMTTEPVGYLVATWLALEDITAGSGPLHYYPGSHRLPYILGEHFDHGSNAVAIGSDLYGNYEKKIASIIEEKNLEKKVFLARKGDLFIWHANILHGGEPVSDTNATRKSLVTHYFCKGDIICYHEITQRPAILPR